MNDVIMMIIQDIENMLDSKTLGFIQCTTSDSVTYNFNGVDYKIKVDEIKDGVVNEN